MKRNTIKQLLTYVFYYCMAIATYSKWSTPVSLVGEKLWQSEGELCFINSLKQFVFDDALTHDR